MKLQRHKRDWEEMAAVDPFWAVLTDPRQRHGGWPTQAFFETGTGEIANIMQIAETLGYSGIRKSALDFGCGLGRTTRALAQFVEECVGVDISERMVVQAQKLNVDCHNCTFLVSTEANLRHFESSRFDFVYCNLVLQHQPNRNLAVGYIGEFLRVLRPGGMLVFQMPSFIPWRHRLQIRRRLYRALRRLGVDEKFLYQSAQLFPMRMISLPERDVRTVVAQHGGEVVHIEAADDQQAPIQGFCYFARREGGTEAVASPDLSALKRPR
jgi:SAM-dependent methyltransferase